MRHCRIAASAPTHRICHPERSEGPQPQKKIRFKEILRLRLRMTKSGGRHASARYKNTRICVLSPSPSLSPHGAALTFVKRGAADTPSAKPVLNIHILLFHTPHPQRNGVRALCSGAVSRLPAGKEYKLEFVYPTVGANCVRPPNCHSEPLGEESRFVYFYFALLEILRFAQDDKLVVVGINLCGRAGACSRRFRPL